MSLFQSEFHPDEPLPSQRSVCYLKQTFESVTNGFQNCFKNGPALYDSSIETRTAVPYVRGNIKFIWSSRFISGDIVAIRIEHRLRGRRQPIWWNTDVLKVGDCPPCVMLTHIIRFGDTNYRDEFSLYYHLTIDLTLSNRGNHLASWHLDIAW